MENLSDILNKRKYELLLGALVQHLFVGIILNDLEIYIKVIWPINMLILGFASVGGLHWQEQMEENHQECLVDFSFYTADKFIVYQNIA